MDDHGRPNGTGIVTGITDRPPGDRHGEVRLAHKEAVHHPRRMVARALRVTGEAGRMANDAIPRTNAPTRSPEK
jgi:hypothetical protein